MSAPVDWQNIRKGDKAVFDKMFNYFYQPLCAFVLSYIKDKQVVEDIVIDCFAKIWEEHGSLEIKSSLQNYLVTIVKNSAISYLRKGQPLSSDLGCIPTDFYEEDIDLLEDAGILNKLYDTINKMPEQRRKILKMAAFEGKSYATIALELQISVNTVKTQMSRSYRFLKEELDVTYRTIHFMLLF